MPKFRKKPVMIEAEQWSVSSKHPGVGFDNTGAYVVTIHGQKAYLASGDWIIPEPKTGHFYPCKPDIFAATYEPVD